jgi:hypothetical protein
MKNDNWKIRDRSPFTVHRVHRIIGCGMASGYNFGPDGTPVFRPAWANDAGLMTGVPPGNGKR